MDLLVALDIFRRTVERRSFAAAARDLGVSQATVTRTVQALERRYGVELLRRSTRDMTLTNAGEALLRGGGKLLEAAAALGDRVAAGNGPQLRGRLRVTAPSGLGTRVVAPLIASFTKAHPGLAIELLCTDRYLDLIAENIDVALRVGDLNPSALVQRVLARLPEVLVGAPAYLDGRPPLQRPSDLAAHAFLGLSILRGAAQTLSLTSAVEVETLCPPNVATFDAPTALRECLLAGGGVGRIHLYVVADDLAAGRLREVLPDWRCPTWTLSLVKTARAGARAADAFVEALCKRLASEAGIEAA